MHNTDKSSAYLSKHYKIPKNIVDSHEFGRYLGAIHNSYTLDSYLKAISLFINFLDAKTIKDLLGGDNFKLEDNIMDWIAFQKRLGNIRPTTIKGRKASVQLFYEMNRKPLSWKVINRMIPEASNLKDRAWHREEIKKMMPFADERNQAIVALLKGSGMRKGALPGLKIKHMIKREEWNILEFIVYEGEKEEYHCYCDPEARAYIESYIAFRERLGEILTPESPLFRKDFNKTDIDAIRNRVNPITTKIIDHALVDIVLNAGIRKSKPRKQDRHDQKLVHGFRKFFETALLDAGFDSNWVDMLEGHKLEGLRDNYYRPKDNSILVGTVTADGKKRMLGFVEVMSELIINDEERLRYQNQKLQAKLKEEGEEQKEMREDIDKLRQMLISLTQDIERMEQKEYSEMVREEAEEQKKGS